MSNRLAGERSPYLREHSENPVDWYPWCREAFERAIAEDKPIFLSIGYSTCHWCHVMARESFEDEQVAAILNRNYISIKVDREERPDIDNVYMQVCQALSGSGGWPMTIIMTPDQLPFFAGTYLPKESYGQRMGLISLLNAVSHKWRFDRDYLLKAGEDITDYIRREEPAGSLKAPEALIKLAKEQLASSYDEEHGGFGPAPKFPCAHRLIFMLRLSALSGEKQLRAQVENTLRQMYKGGIFDHFGGGFARYSTDREWLAPHFEKTLYDNALLALCYTEAWQDGHMALYRQVAEDTLDYCLRELRSEGGGFYCAQDADSEGEEGKYYLFTPQEIKSVLGEDAGRHFCECYDITPEGNFEGKSIPNLLLNTRWNFLPEGYEDYREKLRLYRQQRHPLHRDEKILTGWNGLMLMALSRAAKAFCDPRYENAADELAAYLKNSAEKPESLHHCIYEGTCDKALLEDYAFFALGMLEHYSMSYDVDSLRTALELAECICSRFANSDGGYYQTAEDAEVLIKRPLEIFDSALPSGNSAAAVLFDLCFRFTGDINWQHKRDKLLNFIFSRAAHAPWGCCFALIAALSRIYPCRELVCAAAGEGIPQMLNTVTAKYAPELCVLLKTNENAEALAELAPFTKDMTSSGSKSSFYVCSDGVCSLPFTD